MKAKIANKTEKKMIGWWLDRVTERFDGTNLKPSENKRAIVVNDGNNYLGAIMFDCDGEVDICVNPALIGRGYGDVVLQTGVNYLCKRTEKAKNHYSYFYSQLVNNASTALYDRLGYCEEMVGDRIIERCN